MATVQRELAASRSRWRQELHLAAQVHESLLPKPVQHKQIHVDVRYLPIHGVGGDYCQVRFSDPDICYVTMCDVTGHGIGPALLATRVSSEVRHAILFSRPPHQIVHNLNKFICDHFGETGLYLTFVASRIDLEQRQITYSGAGHPCPLLIRRRGRTVEQLASQNSMIGVLPNILEDEPEHTFLMEPGDRLLYYTDGLTETADRDGCQLGVDGLATVAAEAMSVDLFEMCDFILDRVTRRRHGPPTDDVTLIAAEIK